MSNRSAVAAIKAARKASEAADRRAWQIERREARNGKAALRAIYSNQDSSKIRHLDRRAPH